MKGVLRIAREELRLLWRGRVALYGLALLVLLNAVAAFTSWEHWRHAAAERMRYQARANAEFDAQPDRHPHRMVHYGHFVFRPLDPLAAFDPGINAQTGHTLFLEGHRQNSPNFGEVRESSLLLRFGELTPAFVLQVLAPLLLIFVGHASVARERESNLLRVLLAQGVAPWRLVAGKAVALLGFAGMLLSPTLLLLAGTAFAIPHRAGAAIGLGAAYGLWFLLWVAGVVGVSTLCRRGRDALLALLAIWSVCVVLVPRLAPELAATTLSLPTRLETDIAVSRELKAIGDSHDPDDPYFAGFRKQVLARYGVARIEDLPVNYKGLVALEGERLTSELFERHASAGFDRQAAQLRWVDRGAVLSPVLALRRLSMALAGTDLHHYRRFVEQAEQHRFQLVQALNRLQAEKLSLTQDRSSRDDRISRQHWHGLAEFHHRPPSPAETLGRAAPAAGVLLLWLALLGGLLALGTRRLARSS